MKKNIICLALIFLCFFVTNAFAKSYSENKPAVQQSATKVVVMYLTQRCGYCVLAKNFFKANSVAFKSIDIDKSAEGRQQFKALGGRGVPFIIINGRKFTGFNQPVIKKALGI